MIDYKPFPKLAPSNEEINKLINLYNGKLHPLFAKLMLIRGLDTKDKIRKFFRPVYEDLHDPFLMKGMEDAVSRIKKAVENEEKVLFYGDYDVDGITSVAMAYGFFTGIYGEKFFDFYIPDRNTDGYGLTISSLEKLKDKGYSLLITFDCGINAVEEVEFARQFGIDVIITDHHNPEGKAPDALAVIDPKLEGNEYPDKDLSGCAVGFKLLQAYSEIANIGFSYLYQFVDLVAVSIAADIVPIIGENRILCKMGLDKLNNNPSEPFAKLIEVSGLENKNISVERIVFGLAPRLNASGRLKNAYLSLKFLLGEDLSYAERLNELNEMRRNIEEDIKTEIFNLYSDLPENKFTIVAFNKDWHKGIIGIVASKVVEEFYRPTIIFTEQDGKITGSGRTAGEFNLFEAVKECSHCLEGFGGHNAAVGLELRPGCLEEFADCFERVAQTKISMEDRVPKIYYDVKLDDFDLVTLKNYDIINMFAPFGPGNMKPVFYINNVTAHSHWSKVVGKNNEHLKLYLYDKNGKGVNAIAFGQADKWDKIKNKKFAVCFQISKNVWKEKESVQIVVKQII
jgi:single-stranded-DNA-specific exonuclease